MVTQVDADGEWEVQPKEASGVVVRLLVKPSAAYMAARKADEAAAEATHAAEKAAYQGLSIGEKVSKIAKRLSLE